MPSLIFSGPFWAFFAKFPEKSHFFIKNGVFGHVRLENGPRDPSRTTAKKSIRNFEPSKGGFPCALADPVGLPAPRAREFPDPGEGAGLPARDLGLFQQVHKGRPQKRASGRAVYTAHSTDRSDARK